jgi:AraC-like DNA-binding protein
MAARLTGALYVYPTHVLYVGALIASVRHKHHAGQVMWVPGGLDVEDEDGSLQHVVSHIVPPNRFHAHGAAPAAAVLWVERDDLVWNRVAPIPRDASGALLTLEGASFRAALGPDQAREIARALLAVVTPDQEAQPSEARHPAVRRMCALLDSAASETEVSLEQLQRRSGLSARQLRHRFTQELGLNPSAYLRWRRLRQAIAAIEQGATLTEAAMAGGFADGAHFSRVFQTQFGMAPSQALSSVRFGGQH